MTLAVFFVRKIDRLLQTSIQECAMRYLTTSLRLSVSPLRSSVRWTLVVGCLDVLLPVISQIINLSLSSGHFSDKWKEALVIPILKKPGLVPTQINNLHPVGNLHFISKLTERAVFDQIHRHMSRFALYQTLQSSYRRGHNTDTRSRMTFLWTWIASM